LTDPKGHIKFEDVSFKYPSRAYKVLKNVNFEVPASQTIALVGASGSGKSSCVSIIRSILYLLLHLLDSTIK
jgi:ATP-binding cassette subfamily B protein